MSRDNEHRLTSRYHRRSSSRVLSVSTVRRFSRRIFRRRRLAIRLDAASHDVCQWLVLDNVSRCLPRLDQLALGHRRRCKLRLQNLLRRLSPRRPCIRRAFFHQLRTWYDRRWSGAVRLAGPCWDGVRGTGLVVVRSVLGSWDRCHQAFLIG